MSSYVLLLFLIILNVVQLFTTAIVVTVHALAIVVNVVSQHTACDAHFYLGLGFLRVRT